MGKTRIYDGELSYIPGKQIGFVPGVPRVRPGEVTDSKSKRKNIEFRLWQIIVARAIHEKIRDGELRSVPKNEECNLEVTFFVNSERHTPNTYPDVDNLLEGLCDALKGPIENLIEARARDLCDALKKPTNILQKDWLRENYKGVMLDLKLGNGDEVKKKIEREMSEWQPLIPDDRDIRDVRARRVMDEKDEQGEIKEGASIEYVITKAFYIEEVRKITREEARKYFRSYWENPMQLILARNVIRENGTLQKCERDKPYGFIDNKPGDLYLRVNEDMGNLTRAEAKLIPPGYEWKEGEIVEGCMVFLKKPSQETKDNLKEDFFWLTKWP